LIAVTWGAFIGEHGETIIDGVNGIISWFQEHTNGTKNWDKHTKPHSGRPNTKQRKSKNWEQRNPHK
jgi:hypothetical protein